MQEWRLGSRRLAPRGEFRKQKKSREIAKSGKRVTWRSVDIARKPLWTMVLRDRAASATGGKRLGSLLGPSPAFLSEGEESLA